MWMLKFLPQNCKKKYFSKINSDNKMIEKPREYIINLDASPKERWNDIMKEYRTELHCIKKFFLGEIAKAYGGPLTTLGHSFMTSFFSALSRLRIVYFGEELEGMAQAGGMSLGDLTVVQLAYEAFAMCTSIICKDGGDKLLHIRSMDWDGEYLKRLTIAVRFFRGGMCVSEGVTWP